jgi:hypothetical protein
VTRLDAAMSLLWDAPVETPALRLGFVSASLDETQIRLGFARNRRHPGRRPVELDFLGFALRVIDPGLHVVFRFVRD